MATTYLIPQKELVINSTTKYPVEFLDNNDNLTTAVAGTKIHFPGFIKAEANKITRINIHRGLSPKYQVVTINFNPTGGMGAAVPTNSAMIVEFEIETTRRDFAFIRPEYEYGVLMTYEITVNPGDTPAVLANKLVQAVNANTQFATNPTLNYKGRVFIVKASIPAAGIVELTIQNPATTRETYRGAYIKLNAPNEIAFKNAVDQKWSVGTTGFATALPTITETTRMHKGIGYGSDLEFKHKMQFQNNLPYNYDFDDVPVETELYTEINFMMQVSRVNPYVLDYADEVRFGIWVKESGNAAYITSIIDFFTQGFVGKFTKNPTFSAGFNTALALTNVAAASTATQLNSAHGSLASLHGPVFTAAGQKYVVADCSNIDNVTASTFLNTRLTVNA